MLWIEQDYPKMKKPHVNYCLSSGYFFFCRAQNRTRTCTAVKPLVPETSVSTNFTIWADGTIKM